jgi:hypothetical protein
MKKSKFETAENIAKAHFAVEPRLTRINLIEPLNDQDPNDPIKLLEVVEGTIERGIEPVAFPSDPARGIEYSSVVVEVSPTEYDAIRTGELGFGNDNSWKIGRELPRG